MEKSNIVEFITFTSMTQIWVHYPVSRILDIETVATVVKRNAWWVRDVRDYRIHSDREKAIITDGSVFNIEGIYESAY